MNTSANKPEPKLEPKPKPEPLPEFRQPAPFIQFQVVPEGKYLFGAIYALDTEGRLWFRQISPPMGERWIREEMCGKARAGAEREDAL